MKTFRFVRVSVALAFLAVACHDSPSGTRSTDPPAFMTLTLDGPVPYDNSPIWGGLNLFEGTDGSTSIVSMDYVNNRLRYAHCVTGCDSRSAWTLVTIDSGGVDGFNSGAAMGAGGLYAVYGQAVQGIRFAQCTSACDSASNWQTTTLFGGFLNGPHSNPLAVDGSGGLHLVFEASGGGAEFVYAHCVTTCGNGASWTQLRLDSLASAFNLIAEPSGRLDLVFQSLGGLTYLACDSGCTTGSNWTRTVLDPGGARSTALASAGGVLHLAYADTANAVHYYTCSTSCTMPTSWHGGLIGQTSPSDVAIGFGGGRVAIATSQAQLVVSSCMSACTSPAAWQAVTVDSARAAGGGYLSVGIDATGLPRVASTVNWLQYTRVTQ